MTSRELEQYKSLRATIRQRGTARVWIFLAGLAAWAFATIATTTLSFRPAVTLLPLLLLAGTFEAVFALHSGVERVGRYLQVFYEPPGERNWERTIMAFGSMFPGGGSDPLFAMCFVLATLANLGPAALAPPSVAEGTVTGVVHLLFVARIAAARRQSARQRATDRERFETLKATLDRHRHDSTGTSDGKDR